MKNFWIKLASMATMGGAVLSSLVFPGRVQASDTSTKSKQESPLACNAFVDAATLQLLAEWTIQERMCCPFLDIDLRLEREGGPLWLRLTGRNGTKEFIKMEAAAWISQ